MEAIYATVGKDAFEAITYHPYSNRGIDVAWTESLRTICVRNGDLDCELWANEYTWNPGPREKRQTTYGIGDLFGATQLRYAQHYRALGAEPRDLIRSADKMLFELSEKIGPIPGTDLKFFATNPVASPRYERALDVILPKPGAKPTFYARAARGLVDFGARVLPG